jgi:hypothetical protein
MASFLDNLLRINTGDGAPGYTAPTPKTVYTAPRPTALRSPSNADYIRKINTGEGAPGYTAPVNNVREFQSPILTTYTGGGGGSSSSTSGGGGTSTTTPVNPGDDDVDTAREDALQAALDAIAAQYGAKEAELLADLAGVGTQYRLRTQALAKQEEVARRAALEDSVRRGIARSSLAASAQNDITTEVTDTQAQIAGEFGTDDTVGARGTRAQSIQSALQLLLQQLQSAETQATSQSQAGEVDLESLLALIGTGINGSNVGG